MMRVLLNYYGCTFRITLTKARSRQLYLAMGCEVQAAILFFQVYQKLLPDQF